MWQCPTCAEQHEDSFDACWKCGTDKTGVRNADFCISEPVTSEDQLPVANDSQLPVLQLPMLTYFCIPPFLLLFLAMLGHELSHSKDLSQPGFAFSPAGIVAQVLATLLIWIPVSVQMTRVFYQFFGRKHCRKNDWSDILWVLSMFRLPESFDREYRWFVPIYYGSIMAYIVVPIGMIVWRILLFQMN